MKMLHKLGKKVLNQYSINLLALVAIVILLVFQRNTILILSYIQQL